MQIAARNPLLPARRAGCPGPCAWPTVAGSAAACWRTRAPAPPCSAVRQQAVGV